MFVLAVQNPANHAEQKAAEVRVERNVNIVVAFIEPVRVPLMSVKKKRKEGKSQFSPIHMGLFTTYSGVAMKIPSNSLM